MILINRVVKARQPFFFVQTQNALNRVKNVYITFSLKLQYKRRRGIVHSTALLRFINMCILSIKQNSPVVQFLIQDCIQGNTFKHKYNTLFEEKLKKIRQVSSKERLNVVKYLMFSVKLTELHVI